MSESAARGRENFEFFLNQRAARLVALQNFLVKFSVNATLDDPGLAAVSAWLPGNCGALVANLRSPTTRGIFFQLAALWAGEWRGMNVIFDLGVFLGECLIARNERLHWVYEPGMSDDGSANHTGYGISGFKQRRNHLDPAGHIYGQCGDDETDFIAGQTGRYVRPEYLVGKVRDFSTR